MNKILLVSVFLSCLVSFEASSSYLYDRLMTQKLWRQTQTALDWKQNFKEQFHKADQATQKRILTLGKELQLIFPKPILESYLKWRVLRPNDKKAIQVLKYALLYRLLILRDTIDSPHSTNEQIQKAKEFLKKYTDIPELNSENIWSQTHELIDHKAKVLHAIEDDKLLAVSLKETAWLSQQTHIPSMTHYVISPIGHLEGNQQRWVNQEQLPSTFKRGLNNLKKRVMIESNVLIQYPQVSKQLKDDILTNKQSSLEYHLIFHTPQDQGALLDWENFREENGLSQKVLNFIIRPHSLISPLSSSIQSDVEAAPFFPRELNPIHSHGGLICFDPTSQKPKTLLTGPLSIPRNSALMFEGPAAAAFVMASELPVAKDWIPEVKNVNQKREQGHKVRPIRLFSKLKLQEIRPALVDMIKNAQNEILIDQYFVFDSHVVQSLIKRKIQKPQLDIRILMDHNLNYSMGGFPNTLFLSDMIQNGLNVKSRIKSQSNSSAIIVDGSVGLIGPQNLIPTQLNLQSTLQSVQLFGGPFLNPRIAEFNSDWEDSRNLYELNIKQFRFTTPTEILNRDGSKLLNAIGAEFLRQTD